MLIDQGSLMTYFNYPAAHRIHERTTNPIKSMFATVKLRTKKTRESGIAESSSGDGLSIDACGSRSMEKDHIARAGCRGDKGHPIY